jgi:hypothetical protein
MLAAAQVRTEVATRLAAVALSAGRVFEGRYHPATEAELPCWFVAIDAEDIDAQGVTHAGLNEHRLRLAWTATPPASTPSKPPSTPCRPRL